MYKRNKIGIVIGLASIYSMSWSAGMAATEQQEPLQLQADTIAIRDGDGYMMSRGNIEILQGANRIEADYLRGNRYTGKYDFPGKMMYTYGTGLMKSTDVTYDRRRQEGAATQAEGYDPSGLIYFRGTGVSVHGDTILLKKGLLTTPHAVADVPDYYVTGDNIIVKKGQKITMDNARFWVKHSCVFSYGHYEKKIGGNQQSVPWAVTLFPKPSHTEKGGWGFGGYANFALNEAGTWRLESQYRWSVRSHFAPSVKLSHYSPWGRLRFAYSKETSDNNEDPIWITKFPEWEYQSPKVYLGNTGVFFSANASWGNWRESAARMGRHSGVHGIISHVPWQPWPKAQIQAYAGYRQDWYALEQAQRRDTYMGVVVTQRIHPQAWVTGWYKRHRIMGYTPYRFDRIAHPRQSGISFAYAPHKKDVLMYTLARNSDTGALDARIYTWIHDLHAAIMRVTYKQLEGHWEVLFKTKDF